MKPHTLTAHLLNLLALMLETETDVESNTEVAVVLRNLCLDDQEIMQDLTDVPFLFKETLSAYASLAELIPTANRNNQIAQGLRRLAEYDDGNGNQVKPKPQPVAHKVSIHEIKEALWRSGHLKEHEALQGYIQERDEFLAFLAA